MFRAEGDNEERGHLGEAVSERDRDAGAGRDAFQPSLQSRLSDPHGTISRIQQT